MAKSIYTTIPVLIGAIEQLVGAREMRSKYFTNRAIKEWATFFLLKGLTDSGKLQHWIKQKHFLLDYLGCNEQTFRSRLNALKKLGLVEMGSRFSINLVSYKKAAAALGIEYMGVINFNYENGNSTVSGFAYALQAAEIHFNQDTQRQALLFHIENNPELSNLLKHQLVEEGCCAQKLKDPIYFQEKLLNLQLLNFKQGSDRYTEIMFRRADVNRGVKKIAKAYGYKSPTSVSYLKRVLAKLGLAGVRKKYVTSDVRSRRIVPAEAGKVQGYVYLPRQKATRWHLCDQLTINNEIFAKNEKKKTQNLAVAA